MGPLVTAMSAEASDMSSYLLMGIPGLAYLSGVADASWTAIGLAAGTYLNFLLVNYWYHTRNKARTQHRISSVLYRKEKRISVEISMKIRCT